MQSQMQSHNVQVQTCGHHFSAEMNVPFYSTLFLFCLQEFKPAHRTCKELPALLVKAASSPVCISVRPSVLAAAVLAVSVLCCVSCTACVARQGCLIACVHQCAPLCAGSGCASGELLCCVSCTACVARQGCLFARVHQCARLCAGSECAVPRACLCSDSSSQHQHASVCAPLCWQQLC